MELECKLQEPWTDIRSDSAEVGTGAQRAIWVGEIDMIQQIEGFCAELESGALSDSKILQHCGVNILVTRPEHGVSLRVSKRSDLLQGKVSRIEVLRGLCRMRTGCWEQWIPKNIGSVQTDASMRYILAIGDIERKPALHRDNSRDLPSGNYALDEPVVGLLQIG